MQTTFDNLSASARIDDKTVAALLGVTRVTVWRWAKTGVIPQPHRLGRTTRWLAGDIRDVINHQPQQVAA